MGSQQPVSNSSTFLQQQNLEEEKKGTYISENPLVLYYHSNLDRSHSDVVLLVEVQVLEVSRTVEVVHAVGYCLLSPLVECKQKTELILKGSWLSSERQPTGFDLRYSLGYHPELKNLVQVVPTETLINCNEEVPCLANLQVPSTPERAEIALSRSWIMKVRNFDIFVPLPFEEEIHKQGLRFKDALVNNTGERGVSKGVVLKRRKLRLGFHNGWRMVGELVRSLHTVEADK